MAEREREREREVCTIVISPLLPLPLHPWQALFQEGEEGVAPSPWEAPHSPEQSTLKERERG